LTPAGQSWHVIAIHPVRRTRCRLEIAGYRSEANILENGVTQSEIIAILAETCGWLGVGFSLFAFHSKTMIPLRWATIVANVLTILWNLHTGNGPSLVLNALLLPLNILRLREMYKLIADVRKANEASSREAIDFDWLKPYMREVDFAAGTFIFRKGDKADAVYVIGEGQVALTELGVILGPGSLMGEMGLFASGNRRMSGASCMSAVRAWRISYEEFEQLYFQNPEFGFHIMRMMMRRMESNLARFSGQKFAAPSAGAAPQAPGGAQAPGAAQASGAAQGYGQGPAPI
jgi:CRP/FNR family cyclic AMP-dependent transcriptional regulator